MHLASFGWTRGRVTIILSYVAKKDCKRIENILRGHKKTKLWPCVDQRRKTFVLFCTLPLRTQKPHPGRKLDGARLWLGEARLKKAMAGRGARALLSLPKRKLNVSSPLLRPSLLARGVSSSPDDAPANFGVSKRAPLLPPRPSVVRTALMMRRTKEIRCLWTCGKKRVASCFWFLEYQQDLLTSATDEFPWPRFLRLGSSVE